MMVVYNCYIDYRSPRPRPVPPPTPPRGLRPLYDGGRRSARQSEAIRAKTILRMHVYVWAGESLRRCTLARRSTAAQTRPASAASRTCGGHKKGGEEAEGRTREEKDGEEAEERR